MFIEATDKSKYDPLTFLKNKEETIRSILKKKRTKRKRIKFYLTLQMRFTKTKDDQVEIAEPHFHGRCHILLNNDDIESALRESIMKMFNAFIEHSEKAATGYLTRFWE